MDSESDGRMILLQAEEEKIFRQSFGRDYQENVFLIQLIIDELNFVCLNFYFYVRASK